MIFPRVEVNMSLIYFILLIILQYKRMTYNTYLLTSHVERIKVYCSRFGR